MIIVSINSITFENLLFLSITITIHIVIVVDSMCVYVVLYSTQYRITYITIVDFIYILSEQLNTLQTHTSLYSRQFPVIEYDVMTAHMVTMEMSLKM